MFARTVSWLGGTHPAWSSNCAPQVHNTLYGSSASAAAESGLVLPFESTE
jgi:hypothetical protein